MEEKMIKFLNAQKQAIEEQEKSNAVFKAAIEEVLNEKLPEPIKCNAGENKTVVHFISELDKLFPTVEDLEIYLSQMVDKEADKGGYFYPPLNEVAGFILNPQDDHGIYTIEYIVEKEGCKDVATLVFVAKEDTPPVEPEIPKEPEYGFSPFIFAGFKQVIPSAKSIIYEVKVPDDGQDHTDLIQAQINEFPSGTADAPTIVRLPSYAVWTEGNPEELGIKKKNCIILVEDKHFFSIESGHFYTKAPSTPYGGNVSANRYSHRRHFKFLRCSDGVIDGMKLEGSNLIDGSLLGKTKETTPDFWYVAYKVGAKVPEWFLAEKGILLENLQEGDLVPAPHDNGSIGGAPGYRMDWEFEHGFDFESCQRMIVKNCYVNGVWGDGVCIGAGNEDIIITHNHLRFCGRQGVAIYNSKRILLEYNFSDTNRRADFDFEPYNFAGYANEIEARFNKLHAVQVSIAAMGKGNVSDIHIHHNEYSGGAAVIANTQDTGVVIRKNWTWTNNVRVGSFGSPSASMKFYNMENIYIADNVDTLNSIQSRTAAQFINCKNVIWKNNEIWFRKHGVTDNWKANETMPANIHKVNSEVSVIGGTPVELIEI